jgi:hypothetical protein
VSQSADFAGIVLVVTTQTLHDYATTFGSLPQEERPDRDESQDGDDDCNADIH